MSDPLDAQIREEKRKRAEKGGDFSTALDAELYGEEDRSNYVMELDGDDGMGGGEEVISASDVFLRAGQIGAGARRQHMREAESGGNDAAALREFAAEGGSGLANTRIADRDNEYKRRHRSKMTLSPERAPGRSYADILQENQLAREKDDLERKLAKQQQDRELLSRAVARGVSATSGPPASASVPPPPAAHAGGAHFGEGGSSSDAPRAKRRRWDDSAAPADVDMDDSASTVSVVSARAVSVAESETTSFAPPPSTSRRASKWEATPLLLGSRVGGSVLQGSVQGSDATPVVAAGGKWDDESDALPVPSVVPGARRSRWDETPSHPGLGGGGTAVGTSRLSYNAPTPLLGAVGLGGATPLLASGGFSFMSTPLTSSGGLSLPSAALAARVDADVEARNKPLTDEELDAVLPTKGYKVVDAPTAYVPIRTPARKLMATPTPSVGSGGFTMGATPSRDSYGIPAAPGDGSGGDVPFVKPEDAQFFSTLLEDTRPDSELTGEEVTERRVASLLLRIKNGAPPQRKTALRSLVDNAKVFGAGPLFNAILPLLMSPSLEDQERHVLVKVVDRLLFRLDEDVRPFAHKILVVVEPMLIDEDYYARIEGRELVANLAKAAGLATMIAVMRPDLDNVDEYVRNTTARAFAVVASALGVPALLPFLKAVCGSKKSWQARHTGAKIVQQTSILMGCAILPHLKALVSIVSPSLADDQQKVRIMGALALASLAEAAHPYGIEAFDEVLRPLWKGLKTHRGKALAAFLKAVGFVIPLMEPGYAAYYTKEVMPTLVREFGSPDEEMKRIVLKVVAQTCACEGVTAAYLRTDVLPDYFRAFWQRRLALDKRSGRAVVDTTLALAQRVGAPDVLVRIVEGLKDESEPYRRLVAEGVDKVLSALGAGDVPSRLEELLLDGALYAFQEQASENEAENKVILGMFTTLVGALGTRCKPYLPQIAGTIKWRLNNKSHTVRMLAADLCARVAPVMKACGEDGLLGHLGVVLYECLGEEYPDVLGSLLGGLRSIVAVIGMEHMTPPIRDLLPRLTPILKNRHEKVQESCIDLVGRIADRGAAHVSAREWMRICFELLEMLRAPRKAIRRAAVNTFGYIAKAIGPQDVLHTLLNNLKVQERTNRVCTTVAIAIVAETCAPFTVLPALMNEYRTPEMNVQNGVLKALSFMAEYIGPMARDYVYALAPLLEDALIDRDAVHRQIAATAVKHLALGVQGLGCEDALTHLLNFVWPNILETSPHVIGAVLGAVEALRVSLGCGPVMGYLLQGLFHPARRVREVYWRLYNNTYVYAGDALTPLYPRMPVEEEEGEEGEEGEGEGEGEGESGATTREGAPGRKDAAAQAERRAVFGPGAAGPLAPPSSVRYDRTYLNVFL